MGTLPGSRSIFSDNHAQLLHHLLRNGACTLGTIFKPQSKGNQSMKIASVVSIFILTATSALAAGAPNLTGQWSIHNSIAGNESDQECKFVQTETTLTGTCKGTDKELQITGSIDGNKVTWKYDSDYNGTPLTLTYKGTIDDAGKITGSVDVDPFSVTGDFTAIPSKEPAK
jgi:hypothetical protein